MKRILYCEGNIDGTIGGSYFSLLYLVTGLERTRYQPLVVFYHDNFIVELMQQAGVDTRILEHPGVADIEQPGKFRKGMNLLRHVVLPALKFVRFLKRERIDLLHLNNSVEDNHAWMLAALWAGIPCVCHERDFEPRLSRMTYLLTDSLQCIICVSRAVQDNLLAQGVGEGNSEVVHNGIDVGKVQPTSDPLSLRQRWNIAPTQRIIGMIGNITEWKGQEVVVEAVARLKERFPDILCLLVGGSPAGDQEYMRRLKHMVLRLGLAKNIRFMGYQKHVADFISVMDVVIHASITPEPFGRVVVEAMSLAKPIVAARAGGVPEIIQDGQTGLLYTPGDAEELAENVARLLLKPEWARTMGQAALHRVKQNFHIQHNVQRTTAIYDRILAA